MTLLNITHDEIEIQRINRRLVYPINIFYWFRLVRFSNY